MRKRRFRVADWRWILAPIALVALVLQAGGTTVAAQAGRFPAFVPMSGVAPRGVAVDKIGHVYVSVGQGTGASEHIVVWKFAPDGEPLFSVDIGQGTIGGLAIQADGDLYVALAAGTDRGVYRMDRDGHIDLVPGTDQIFFANGLAFDDRGTLYITESVSLSIISGGKPAGPGGIWRVVPGGDAELWMQDEVLRGTGALGQPVWVGANGIAYYQGGLYVSNTEKGTLIRIPMEMDGDAGEPEVWALQPVPESPMPLPPMGDGIVFDVHGNLYVAVLTKSAVVRINAGDLSQETVAVFRVPDSLALYAPLDFPASLYFGTGKGERTNLFVTNLGMGKVVAPALPWAGPGLVKIDAGVPGLPLQ